MPAPELWEMKDYPVGTIGNKHFPELLDGRKRLKTALDNSPERYLSLLRTRSKLVDIEGQTVVTVGSLLKTEEAQLEGLLKGWKPNNRQNFLDSLNRKLDDLFRRIIFSPDDRLMARVFGRNVPQEVLTESPENEEDRGKAIRGVLSELASVHEIGLRGVRIVRMHFGLDDWAPISYEEVGRVVQLSEFKVRQMEDKTLRAMRHKDRIDYLAQYLPNRQP